MDTEQQQSETKSPASFWGIVEKMGHVRLAGLITEEELFGGKIGRVDIPHGDSFITQYFTPQSLYGIIATTEEVARRVAANSDPLPVYLYALPHRPQDNEPGFPVLSAGDVQALHHFGDDDGGFSGEYYGNDEF